MENIWHAWYTHPGRRGVMTREGGGGWRCCCYEYRRVWGWCCPGLKRDELCRDRRHWWLARPTLLPELEAHAQQG